MIHSLHIETYGPRINKYYDFNVRLCAIRETFEEINLLITKPLDKSQSSIRGIVDKSVKDLY